MAGCRKAPLHDVGAAFALADTSWFEEEDTLFVFYELTAAQGLNDASVVEISWTTDEEVVPYTPLTDLPLVHTHLPVDCGPDTLCGSASFQVPIEPRDVRVRFRYHRDGALDLDAPTVFNVVGPGPAHTHRSLVAYGVFDEDNERVQWRARHQFPTLRNARATELGLRRSLVVRDPGFGTATLATPRNPYGYGVACPDTFVALDFGDLQTIERAIFAPDALPLGASDASTVCAEVTVTDANGTFSTGALARKNPEVRAAFPVLRSPIRDATPLKFFLGPCERAISAEHEAMLRQRLLMGDLPTTCIDDWGAPGFVADLAVMFQDAVEAARPAGDDLVLVIALSQDEPGVSEAVEQALALVVPQERHRATPRLAGAFVLDSDARGLSLPELAPVTLWCPSVLDLESTDASTRTCAIAPVNLALDLGPFTFGSLPILPDRDGYLDFIDTWSVGQAGEVDSLTLRAPEFATTADHLDFGEFGVVTFLDNETISAEPDDAFSHCVVDSPDFVGFRSELLQTSPEECVALDLPVEICEAEVLGLDLLPDWHAAFAESSYELGILWDFPFLLSMTYEVVAAGSLTAFGFSVPFGFASDAQTYYGTEVWLQEEYLLADELLQCDRFCDHPTFDSAGVYHVTDPFAPTYAHACYLPLYPTPEDDGFPLDP